MNFVSGIFTILAMALGIVVLIPVISMGIGLVAVFAGTVLWWLPILFVVFSTRASGIEKLAWILAMVFLSWFAWIFYFLLAPISDRGQQSLNVSHRYSHNRPKRSYRYQYRDLHDEPNTY